MATFSEKTRLVRYLLGTATGRPPTLDLRDHPGLTESFDLNERLAGLIAQVASTKGFEIPPGPISTTEMVVLGAMASAFNTHSAIQLLCRQGYRDDAFARVRTLFEMALDLRYMRFVPDEVGARAERWLDWAKMVQFRLLGVLERGGDYYEDVRKALFEQHSDELQSVLDAIERVKAKGTHWYVDEEGNRRTRSHWSGKDTAAIAREVGWQTAYDTLFREASQFIHPGMHGFTGLFRFEEPNSVIITAGPSADVDRIRGVLNSAALYFAHIALVWAETLQADEVASTLQGWMADGENSDRRAIAP
jgi:hypothetical protein